MRYKDIRLKNMQEYKLEKYRGILYEEFTVGLKSGLEKLRQIDPFLADAIVKCPSIYSEASDHQAYFISKNSKYYIGAIYIGTSTDEKDLEVQLYLDEDKFQDKVEMVHLINEIVDSLSFYCWDKKHIEVTNLNGIDLESIDRDYKKIIYSPSHTSYEKENKYNYNLSAIMSEMDILRNRGYERICLDVKLPSGDRLNHEYNNNTVPFKEIFYGAEFIVWLSKDENTTFDKYGNIYGSDLNVRYDYSMFENNLNLSFKNSSKKLKICYQNNSLAIFYDQGAIIHNYSNNKKIIEVKTNEENNTSITVDSKIDEENNIEYFNIDFNMHRANKIVGHYHIGIKCGKITVQYRNKKSHIINSLELGDLFSEKLQNITVQDVDNIVNILIPVIMEHARNNNRVININYFDIESLLNIEKEAVGYVSDIKDGVQLPSLKQKIESFLDNYSNGKIKVKNN